MSAKPPRRFAYVFRTLGSLLRGAPAEPAPGNRVVRPWRRDSDRSYPTAGLTPTRLRTFLQSADAGYPQLQFELFDEMLQKWPRLAAVENTRRLALTGLDWELTPGTTPTSDAASPAARAAADFCRSALRSLPRFRDTLTHLANAIGYGVAVAELVWRDAALVDIVPLPYNRLISDPHEPWRLRVLTESSPTRGLPLDEQLNKWIIHRPRPSLGRPFDGGLLRASTMLFLAQNLSFKDWLIYSQIAGTPIRVAQFEPGTPDEEKRALVDMLSALGTEAVAAFGKNIDLEFIDPARSSESPYQALQEHCNNEVTILWLGQHLTTDIRNTGSRAAAEIHDRVREDLLVDDIADESQTIRRDLLTPLVRNQFGPDVPVPHFRRALVQSVDTKVLADTLAVAVNELGLSVPAGWVRQSLGIPAPGSDEPVLRKGNLS